MTILKREPLFLTVPKREPLFVPVLKREPLFMSMLKCMGRKLQLAVTTGSFETELTH